MANDPDPTKDKEFNAALRRALAMPHKPQGEKTGKRAKQKRKTATRARKVKQARA